MSIPLDDFADKSAPEVVDGPGHTRVTANGGDGLRHYLRAGNTAEKYASISGLPWPSGFEDARGYMCGTWAQDHRADIAAMDLADVRAAVANGGKAELNKAARRGTAVHHYLEAETTGAPVDWPEIEASGATDWIRAADKYLADHPPITGTRCEVVVFGESGGVKIAGTVDVLELTGKTCVIRDYKTRGSRHDRRASEVAQLGGYADCVLHGEWLDERGRGHQVEHVQWVEVVTFCPDGTYAIHQIATDVALYAHRARMPLVAMTEANLFAGPPIISAPAPSAAEHFAARLADLAPEAQKQLAPLWVANGMPRMAELGDDLWWKASALFAEVGPFRGINPEPAEPADPEAAANLSRRISRLPFDLHARANAAMRGRHPLTSPVLDVNDLADWEDAYQAARQDHQHRLDEIANVLKVDLCRPLTDHLGDWAHWTEADLEAAYVLRDAIDAGHVDRDGVTDAGIAHLEAHGKRDATTAAKACAAELGRPKPTKFADICTDVVTFSAAVVAVGSTGR